MNKEHDFIPAISDTDSISFRKQDGAPFTDQEQQNLIDEINQLFPEKIVYEHDGYFETIMSIKAKNYVMRTHDMKISMKGNSIRDPKKEPALSEMLNMCIMNLLDHDGTDVIKIYEKYIKESNNIADMTRWATKRSISAKVLNPERTNEQKVLDAVKHLGPREGDKYFLYTAVDGLKQEVKKGIPVVSKKGVPKMIKNSILRVVDEWTKDEDTDHYTERVYKTITILKNVIDFPSIIKYHLKGNKSKLEELLNE